MLRLFYWLAAFISVLILTTEISVYWLGKSAVEQARQQETDAIAQSAALNLSAYIGQIGSILDNMAQDPEIVAAALSGNKARDLVAGKLEKYLPGIMKVRLLPAGISVPDDAGKPAMGFADLQMVRQTLTNDPAPAVQGEKADRHLAMTRRVVYNGQTVAVLLASINDNVIQRSIASTTANRLFLQLRQGQAVLASATAAKLNPQARSYEIEVLGTGWILVYQPEQAANAISWPTVTAMLIPIALGLLSLLASHRRLSEILAADIQNLLKAFKDMMTDNLQGNYPFRLNELRALFSNLLQFKRVLEHRDGLADTAQTNTVFNKGLEDLTVEEDDFDLDGLFDDFGKTPKPH